MKEAFDPVVEGRLLVEEVNGDYFCDCREGIKGINQYSIKVYNQYSIKVHNHYSIKF